MSLLAELLAEEKIIPAVQIATEEKISVATPPATPSPGSPSRILPCPACSCPTWWRSIYSPELHCRECSPPPSPRLVAEIVNAGDDASSLGDENTRPGQPVVDSTVAHSAGHTPGRELRSDILFTTHRPGCFWPDFSRASASSLRPAQGQLKREPPCCPHCGAEMTRANIVKQELKPKRGGWARGSCKACGKEVWPLISWLPGERSESEKEENSETSSAAA